MRYFPPAGIFIIYELVKGVVYIKHKLMLVAAYLGAVIGAGFASGQEIVQFFVNYNLEGIKGVLVATVLFAICGAFLLYLAHAQKTSNYQDMLRYLLGNRLGSAVDILLAGFLYMGIGTMLSASGAMFYEHLYLPKSLGIGLAYVIIVILLIVGKKGLIVSYSILVPIKIILLVVISGYAAFVLPARNPDTSAISASMYFDGGWMAASILYVAYNFTLAMVVLTEYQSVTSRRNSVIGAAWGGLALGLLVVLNYLSMCKFLPEVLHYQVPMLYVAGNINLQAKHLYTIVLWLGIITTAMANAYGFAQRFARFTRLNYGFCLVFAVTMAIPLSMQSFASLVGRVYPIFGALGVIIIAALLYKAIKAVAIELYYRIISLFRGTKEA